MRLAHYRVVTDDVRRLADFYRAVTQAPVVGTDDYMEVQIQPASIAINSRRVMDRHGGGVAVPGANRSAIVDLEVEDVDAERVRLGAIVGEFVLEPTTQPWGNRAMMFRDPDGNLINVFTLPPHNV